MATNQIQQFGLNSYGCYMTTQGTLLFLNDFISLENLAISVAMATNQNQWSVAKFIWLVEDYSRNISIKVLSKYLQ